MLFRDVQVVIDPPRNGAFTFEDTITGRVLFESRRDEILDCCKVYFHCWVGTHVVKTHQNNGQTYTENYKDKDVIFGTSKKIYLSKGETLQKRVRYEWPFQFDFRAEMVDAASLPPSGKYGNGSIDYTIVALPLTPAQVAQGDQHFDAMMNPDDQHFMKESPISKTGIFMAAATRLGGAAQQALPFVKIRPKDTLDGNLMDFQSQHEIAASLVPQLASFVDPEPQRHGFLHKSPHIPFAVNMQIPKEIMDGLYFPVLLSVNSPVPGWWENPPPATLVALKVHLEAFTDERASTRHQLHESKLSVLDAKGLNIPLGGGGVDVGQIFPIRLAGPGIVPSFDTRLMTRYYLLPVEARVEIAGKEFHAKFTQVRNFELVSQHVAVGRAFVPRPPDVKSDATRDVAADATLSAPKEKPYLQLQSSYIGRILHESDGVLKEGSVLEAALAVSRALTKYEVPHEFPGGSLVKILPYKFHPLHSNKTNFDKVTDVDKMKTCFTDQEGLTILEHADWSMEEMLKLKLRYDDNIYGQSFTILFPTVLHWNDDQQKKWGKETRNSVDAIKIDPVSLFNYRLSCAISQNRLTEAQLGDFQGLYLTFSKDLHHHRKNIDINAARIAVEKYPQILTVLNDIGVDLEKGKAKEQERMPAPVMENGRGVQAGYEEDLVKGMKKHSFFHRKH